MRIEQFIHLEKIAVTGSINLASKNLFITQQALSHSIIQLEKELGAQLLKRSKSGVSLTAEGEFVLKESRQIIAISENIRNHFLSQKISFKTHLNISTVPIVRAYLLNKSISYFYKNFPEVPINVSVKTTSEILQDVASGEVDIGFLSEFIISGKSQLVLPDNFKYVPLFVHTMDIMLSAASPLAQYKKLSLKQLSEQTIILLRNPNIQEDIVYKIFEADAFPKLVIADTAQLFMQMIKDDLGCAFFNPIADLAAPQFNSPAITTRPLEQAIHISFGYIVREEKHLKDPFVSIFCEHLL